MHFSHVCVSQYILEVKSIVYIQVQQLFLVAWPVRISQIDPNSIQLRKIYFVAQANIFFRGCFPPAPGFFLELCLPASLLFCCSFFSACLLLCFSLLVCFSAFLCFFASLLFCFFVFFFLCLFASLFFCFFASPLFYSVFLCSLLLTLNKASETIRIWIALNQPLKTLHRPPRKTIAT